MKRIITAFLAVFIVLCSMPTAYADGIETGYINTFNLYENKGKAYMAVAKDNKVYLTPADLADMCGYTIETVSIKADDIIGTIENNPFMKDLFTEAVVQDMRNLGVIDTIIFNGRGSSNYLTKIAFSDGYATTMNKRFSIDWLEHDGSVYLEAERMLYLMHAQWSVNGNNELEYAPYVTGIFDFIGLYYEYLNSTMVQHKDLMMNGEGKLTHSSRVVLSHIFNDVDIRIFIPFGSKMIQKDVYEEAVLQLAATDDSFVDQHSTAVMENMLSESELNLPKNELTVLNKTIEGIVDLPEVAKALIESDAAKYSAWGNFTDLEVDDLAELGKGVGILSDTVTAANIIFNYYKITQRSKSWDADYVKTLKLLETINASDYGKYGKYIVSIAAKLAKEHKEPNTAAIKNALRDFLDASGENLVSMTPAGMCHAVMALSNIIVMSNSEFAAKIEAADLMNTVHAMVDLENVLLREFVDSYHEYLKYLGIESGSSSLSVFEAMMLTTPELKSHKTEDIGIEKMRVALESFIKASLRNKTYIYYFNDNLNKNENWSLSEEAEVLRSDIIKTYTLLYELISTREFDRLLYLDESFKKMNSDDCGCFRGAFDGTVLTESPLRVDPYNSLEIYAPVIGQYEEAINNNFYSYTIDGYVDGWDNIGQYVSSLLLSHSRYYDDYSVCYALHDINSDGIQELIIGAGQKGVMIDSYDLFTHNGYDPVPLFEVGYCGERTVFEIYNDGTVARSGSGGAAYMGYEYFTLPPEGCKLDLQEALSLEVGEAYRVNSEFEHMGSLTDAEFETILERYTKSGTVTLNWVEIAADPPRGEYVGNSTQAELMKSIVGEWATLGSLVPDYEFTADSVCVFMGQKDKCGSYEITKSFELRINFPWGNTKYKWSDESFDEYRSHSDGSFWYMREDGVLLLNGEEYYRNGRKEMSFENDNELAATLKGTWISDDKRNEVRIMDDLSFEKNSVVLVTSAMLGQRINLEKGRIEVVDETSAKAWGEIPENAYGFIPSYSSMTYNPDTDTLSAFGRNYTRAKYTD